MTTGFKLYTFFALILLLSGCNNQEISAPSCRVDTNFHSGFKSSGTCLIRVENKLLALAYSDNTYDLPMRKNLPAESGQCAAHRAVWEDTGLNVEVSAPLSMLENGSWLYACHINGGFDGSELTLPAPPWADNNLVNIAFIDPFSIEINQWRQPDEFINIRDGYTASKQLEKPKLSSNL